jgi:hypothetical protein
MAYKIDPKDAYWLDSALGDKAMRAAFPARAHILVSTSTRFGHTAAAQDGSRLHIVTVDDAIPNGWYALNKLTGEMTALSTEETPENEWQKAWSANNWETVIAPDHKFYGDCEVPEGEPVNDNDFIVYVLHPLYQVKIDAKFYKKAIGKYKQFKIKTQNDAGLPIMIQIDNGKAVQLAVIMPIVTKTVNYTTPRKGK